jgi:hypothetical protein
MGEAWSGLVCAFLRCTYSELKGWVSYYFGLSVASAQSFVSKQRGCRAGAMQNISGQEKRWLLPKMRWRLLHWEGPTQPQAAPRPRLKIQKVLSGIIVQKPTPWPLNLRLPIPLPSNLPSNSLPALVSPTASRALSHPLIPPSSISRLFKVDNGCLPPSTKVKSPDPPHRFCAAHSSLSHAAPINICWPSTQPSCLLLRTPLRPLPLLTSQLSTTTPLVPLRVR